MAHFAKIGPGNIVERVIVVHNNVTKDSNGIEQEQLGVDFINGIYKTNDVWKKTSYNTKGGKYYEQTNNYPILSQDQSKAFRKNYAHAGYIYDAQRDAFYEPQPHESWTLNEDTCIWEPPVPYIYDDKVRVWDETIQNWKIV